MRQNWQRPRMAFYEVDYRRCGARAVHEWLWFVTAMAKYDEATGWGLGGSA